MVPTGAEAAKGTGNPSQPSGHSLESQQLPSGLRLVSAPGGHLRGRCANHTPTAA